MIELWLSGYSIYMQSRIVDIDLKRALNLKKF